MLLIQLLLVLYLLVFNTLLGIISDHFSFSITSNIWRLDLIWLLILLLEHHKLLLLLEKSLELLFVKLIEELFTQDRHFN